MSASMTTTNAEDCPSPPPSHQQGEEVTTHGWRAVHIDRMILACFVLGLSTRKVATALEPELGRRISPGTVSQVTKLLDGAVKAFHRPPLKDLYPVLMLDGVVLSRKTGLRALRRPVLVALGLHPDGKKEVLDYRLATAESAAHWELFLTDLFRRGLEGKNLEMICTDGGRGIWKRWRRVGKRTGATARSTRAAMPFSSTPFSAKAPARRSPPPISVPALASASASETLAVYEVVLVSWTGGRQRSGLFRMISHAARVLFDMAFILFALGKSTPIETKPGIRRFELRQYQCMSGRL